MRDLETLWLLCLRRWVDSHLLTINSLWWCVVSIHRLVTNRKSCFNIARCTAKDINSAANTFSTCAQVCCCFFVFLVTFLPALFLFTPLSYIHVIPACSHHASSATPPHLHLPTPPPPLFTTSLLHPRRLSSCSPYHWLPLANSPPVLLSSSFAISSLTPPPPPPPSLPPPPLLPLFPKEDWLANLAVYPQCLVVSRRRGQLRRRRTQVRDGWGIRNGAEWANVKTVRKTGNRRWAWFAF